MIKLHIIYIRERKCKENGTNEWEKEQERSKKNSTSNNSIQITCFMNCGSGRTSLCFRHPQNLLFDKTICHCQTVTEHIENRI